MLKKVVYGPHSSSTNVDVFSYQLKKKREKHCLY